MNTYDDRFSEVLKEVDNIPSFIDSFFGFLFRRTAFFKEERNVTDIANSEPPEILVRETFRKYQTMERMNNMEEIKVTKTASEIPVLETVEVECSDSKIGVECAENPIEEEEDPKLKKEQERFQNEADSYNGAIRENYCWSQSIKEVDVKIQVPDDIVKGKQVNVNIKSNYLKVSALISGEWKLLIDDQLCWPTDRDNAVWTLVPGEHIHVSLEKSQERWWNALIKSEPCIDIKHINASRPMDELPDEEQAKIQELMFDQEQKLLGKPTIEQLKKQELLREAWDKEGSPFKGMPFDPNMVNFLSSSDPTTTAMLPSVHKQ